jgi:hypothetical protein
MDLAKNSNQSKSVEQLKALFICNFVIILMLTFYYLVARQYVISEQTLSIWQTSLLSRSEHPYLHHILTTAPISFHNLLAPFRFLFNQITVSTPFSFVLIIFTCTTWIYLSHLIANNTKIGFTRIFLFFLILCNPYCATLVVMAPTEALNVIFFSAIIYGMEEINIGVEGRGVLVTAAALVLLFLNGENGIALAASIFLMLPLMLKNAIFKINSLSGYLVTFFPLAASLLGIIYLSFIYQRNFGDFLVHTNTKIISYKTLINWIYLLPIFILPFVKRKNESFKLRLSKTKSFVIPFLTNIIFIFLQLDHNQSTFFGISLVAFAFETLQKKSVNKRHLFFTLIIVILSNFQAFKLSNVKSGSSKDWSKLHYSNYITPEDIQISSYLRDTPSIATAYYSKNFAKLRITHKNHHNQLFPNTHAFFQHYEQMTPTATRIIVENPYSDFYFHYYTQKQEDYFANGIANYRLVLSNKNWKVYERQDGVISKKTKNSVFKDDFKQVFAQELMLSLLVIFVFIALNVNFLQTLKHLFQKKV